jgi:hypothetical protein
MSDHALALCHLHHNQFGFIGYFEECKRIQIVFGVAMFSMEYIDFLGWHQRLIKEKEKIQFRLCPKVKHFVFPTENHHLQLVFSATELGNIIDLIGPGLLVLEARQLLASKQ